MSPLCRNDRWQYLPEAKKIVDSNGLQVADHIPSNEDGVMMAAAPKMANALSLALTYLTDPGATDGQDAVEAAINEALNTATEDT